MLIVEDDPHIGASLVRALEATGYVTEWTRTGADALGAVADAAADLVLLDLGLPDLDGLDLCRRIHDVDPLATIMMLTARGEELDIVIGLDAGAVDYITKPFTLAELLARIRAQLRQAPSSTPDRVAGGDLHIDGAARRVWSDGEEIVLRAKEFDLLHRLVRDAGKVVTREALMADVWDEHWFGSTKTLDFHIASLRRKIAIGARPGQITTVRSVGYRYDVP